MLRTVTFVGIGELATHLIPWCEENTLEKNPNPKSLEDLLGMHAIDKSQWVQTPQLGDMDTCVYCNLDIELQTVDLIVQNPETGEQAFTRDVWVAFMPVIIEESFL